MAESYKIAIIGAGPAGLSAAARAAALGVSHVLFETAPQIAHTIRRFPKRKMVMAEPANLPLRSDLPFAATSRESVLDLWQADIASRAINVRTEATVNGVTRGQNGFRIELAGGDLIEAEFVVLAIGLQGNIRRLSIPGADLPCVQYQLDDPDAFADETILVIGGGDAGVENALALAARNRVVLLNRQDEFNSCSEANLSRLKAAIRTHALQVMTGTTPEHIEYQTVSPFPLALRVNSPQGPQLIGCHRIIARLGATPPRRMLEGFGIRFPTDDASAVPQLSERFESNVPDLHVIGALAGYPLIKQALNQGYEVVEHILGRPIKPVDEPLLQEKFARMPVALSATEGIELIRATQPLLAPLTSLQSRELIVNSHVLVPEEDTILFRKNDYGNSFFFILQGRVRMHLDLQDGKQDVLDLDSGDFFGEIGLLSGRRRSGSAIAGPGCVLIETPRRTLLKLLDAVPSMQRKLDEFAVRRIVSQCFGRLVPEQQVSRLLSAARSQHYGVGELLFREGDAPDALYVIKHGSVTVSRDINGKEVVSAYLSAGSYVGEMALVSRMPRTATIRAAALTEAVLIEADQFNAILDENPAVRSAVNARYLEGVHSRETAVAHANTALAEFLLTQGVGAATNVLLIDYARCIRCDQCQTACGDVHDGTPSFRRAAGHTFETLHIPDACRHCIQPECMKQCPPDAIHRSPDGEVYIGDNCIGCGECRNNCPYGVITLAPKHTFQRPGLMELIFGRRSAHPSDVPGEAPQQKAVKCDLCRELIGPPACVRACPTGAAIRATPNQIMAMTDK